MFFNPWLFVALALGMALFPVGRALAGLPSGRKRRMARGAALLLSLPALACIAYYLHLVGDTPAYISLRSLPGFEALSGGVGFLAGLSSRSPVLPRRWRWLPVPVCLGLLLVPFMKPILLPVSLQGEFQDRWSEGVCLQSGHSTCGPASLNTLMALDGVKASEKETAGKSYSSLSGTEIWYLVRLARKSGFEVDWGNAASLESVPVPAMIGTTMVASGAGHFIVLLGRSPAGLLIGDPLIGRRNFTGIQFGRRYRFSGRWLAIHREG